MKNQGFNNANTIPVNSTAAKVVYGKGVHYDPGITEKHSSNAMHQDVPHRIRQLRTIPKAVLLCPDFIDFSGRKFGMLTVIGLLHCETFNKWVVRCSCGCYEVRKTYSLKKVSAALGNDRCLECADLRRLKDKEHFQQHGYYSWEEPRQNIQIYKEHHA